MKERIFLESEKTLTELKVASQQCSKIAKIQFSETISDSKSNETENKLAVAFEKEILRVETLDCLGALDLEKVFQVYYQPHPVQK